MISAGEFRNGVTFDMDGQVMQIIEFQHVKPGKGAAFVRTKLRNVISGSVVERTFNPTDKFPPAFVERKEMQYLYNDGDLYYFMDLETYEQTPINGNILGDEFKFVKENMNCKLLSYKGNVFGVEVPTFVELEVTGNAGNRRNHQGSALCRYRRCSEDRHAYRRISRTLQKISFFRPFPLWERAETK